MWLSTKPKGATQTRLHALKYVERITGKKAYEPKPLPDELAHVWQWFCSLWNGSLSWGDIYYWSVLTKTPVTPWEAELLMKLRHCISSVNDE